MRELIESLRADLSNVAVALPGIYHLGYPAPGDEQAQECVRLCNDQSFTLLLRLAYIGDLHGLPAPTIDNGNGLEPVLARLQAADGTLAALHACDGLRVDGPMREQMTGQYGSASVQSTIAAMAHATQTLTPQAQKPARTVKTTPGTKAASADENETE